MPPTWLIFPLSISCNNFDIWALVVDLLSAVDLVFLLVIPMGSQIKALPLPQNLVQEGGLTDLIINPQFSVDPM